METQEIKIAVVVLNWNGKIWLKKFLPTLLEYSSESSVFVADNASTDDSLEYVTENFPSIQIIRNKENGGYAKGYNDALTKINATYFVLINSDIEVTKDWLSPIISLMDSDASISACQPKVLDYNNRTKFEYAGASGGFIDNLGYPFCRGRIFDDIEFDNGQYDDACEVFWATGACLFVRSSHYHEVGGLDEDFFAHQEEIDLCWRFKNKGYKIMVNPQSLVYHVGGGTLQVGSPFKTYLNFRNNLYMIFKNSPLFSLFLCIPIRLLLDGVASITFLHKANGLKHLFSILKAHIKFYMSISKLIKKRGEINQKKNLSGKMSYSILLKNKISRLDKFSKL